MISSRFFGLFAYLKTVVSILILSAMVLHASSRLGALAYLYQNKGRIAYALGLASERPITECSSEFYFANRLTVTEETAQKHSAPLPMAREINLFFVAAARLVNEPVTYTITFPIAHAAHPLAEGVAAGLLRPPIFA